MKNDGIIYLAAPYTHPDPAVRLARYDAVTALTARLIGEEWIVYSPITYAHPMTLLHPDKLPIEFEFWRRHARALVEACACLWVYCLDGWRQSVGVQEELIAAEEFGKPVYFYDPERDCIHCFPPAHRGSGCRGGRFAGCATKTRRPAK